MVVRKNEGDPRRAFVRGRRVVCDSRSRRVVRDSRSRRVKDDRGDVVEAFNSVIDLVGGSDIAFDWLVDYLSSDDLEGFIRHALRRLDAGGDLEGVDLKEYGLDGFIEVADGVSRSRRVVRDSRSHRFMVRDNRHRVLKRVHDSRRRLVRDSQEDEDAKVWVDEDVKLVWGLASKGFQPDWSKSRVEILEDAKAFAEEKGVKDSADAPRADFIFPADSSVVNDGKGHYPLNSVARGRAALSYVARAKKLPDWYSGDMSLEEFKKHVQDTVQKAFPSIKVNVSDSSLSDDKMLEILSGTPSEDDCVKVARELRRQGRVSLRDADRKEVIAVGEFQDGSPIYSYKQRAWKSYTA